MSKKFSILLVILTIVSGLIGGAITGRVFTPKVANAEEEIQSKILTVEGIRVVDKDGKLLMNLGQGDNPPYRNYNGLFIYNASGDIGADICVSSWLSGGGEVFVYSEDEKNKVGIRANEFRSFLIVAGGGGGGSGTEKHYSASAYITAEDSRSNVFLSAEESNATKKADILSSGNSASMDADANGSSVTINAKGIGNRSVQMIASELGGRIHLTGKNGSRKIGVEDKNGEELK